MYLINKHNNVNILTLIFFFVFGCDKPNDVEDFYEESICIKESLIQINNYCCLLDSVNNQLFTTINPEELGQFSAVIRYPSGYYVKIKDNFINNGQSYDFGSINIGEMIPVKIIKNDTISLDYSLIFTTLSTISISASSDILDDPKILSEIIINDVGYNTAYKTFAGIELRGGTAQTFPKKSYDLELWADTTESDTRNESLFGLRNDDDWHLDAMFVDLSRTRNILGMDTWSSFGRSDHTSIEHYAKLGQRGHTVELIMNNHYAGVYSMNEQIDRKQLKLDKENGILYKTLSWSNEIRYLGIDSEPEVSLHWNGYDLKFPEFASIENWDPIYNLVHLVAYSDDNTFLDSIESMIDIDNAIDYWLFINAIQANDNSGKNMFIFRYEEGHRLCYLPWDLDLTFGNKNSPYTVDDPDDLILTNNLFDRLFDLNVNNYKEKVNLRWNELYGNNLKNDIIYRLTLEMEKIITSGASLRDNNRWGIDTDYNEKLEYITEWIETRLSFFDNYINQNF